MTMTPLMLAMALSATQNNNQQTKGANKRGDGVKAIEMATAMVTAMDNLNLGQTLLQMITYIGHKVLHLKQCLSLN
jgi:hypothetical protein